MTCASVVYALGDDAFTGRSVLAVLLTLTTTTVVLARATGQEQQS